MVDDTHVSIGQIKRDISELVNRVAYGKERIVLTSRGKPKAALVSLRDYELLAQMRPVVDDEWKAWLEGTDKLCEDILAHRDGASVNVDEIWNATRADLENRNAIGS